MSGGKIVGDHLYAHTSLVPELEKTIQSNVDQALSLLGEVLPVFNVVKVQIAGQAISFLDYTDFDQTAFPELRRSLRVDLHDHSVSERSYDADGNPPILHRKESLLPPTHPRWVEFAALTFACEEAGLFDDPVVIGTKSGWAQALAARGLRVEGHKLLRPDGETSTGVQRHRTAIRRPYLSTPVQVLARHGFLDGQRSVFDYGCGRGDDVRYLRAMGINASGWDPHYSPAEPRRPADIVNLGFVINVIESENERRLVIRNAFDLAKQLLVVSAMLEGRQPPIERSFADGVLTCRATFQKYFTQESLRAFLTETLGEVPVAAGPGIFLVFRDKEDEQRFLVNRQRRSDLGYPRPQRTIVPRPSASERAEARYSENRAILDPLWETCLRLGREPHPTELPVDLLQGTQQAFGSTARAVRFLLQRQSAEALEESASARTEDLLVYVALNLFARRVRYGLLPGDLQRDIKSFFGSYERAETTAKGLLFSVGKPEVVAASCQKAAEAGLGYLESGRSLQFHTSLLSRLPAVLRCYVGCGSVLYGDIEEADLVKIHIDSGKLTLLLCDDFWGSPLPTIVERIKIDMRRQKVDLFDSDREHYLYLKSRYLAPDSPGYDPQMAFDKFVQATVPLDYCGQGPSKPSFDEALRAVGLTLAGWALAPTSSVQRCRSTEEG